MTTDFVLKNWGWLPVAAPLLYLYVYAWLRAFGKLRVSAQACHAGGIVLGKWVVLPALAAFGLFQPAMRAESAVRQRIAGRRKAVFEPPVRDVAVELVRLT